MDKTTQSTARPPVVERAVWQAETDAFPVRGKAYTHEGDAIAPLDGGCRWSRSMRQRA
jgi:hypothetical protein